MRIRSLKPGFFLNERLADLSPWHRLCFAGLWCVADREGRLEDRPRRLKAAIFPYDELEIDPLLTDLARAGFIVRYEVAGQRLIWLPAWPKHQFPRRDEPESKLPAYEEGTDIKPSDATRYSTVTDPSLPSDGPVTAKTTVKQIGCTGRLDVLGSGNWDPGDGNWDLGDGVQATERASRELPPATLTPPPSDAPAKSFVALWNEVTTPPIPRCLELTDDRRQKIRTRLRTRPITQWRLVFEKIEASPFCRGETDRGWRANLDWVIRNDTIATSVLEGKYDARAGPAPASVRTTNNRAAMRIAAQEIRRATTG